MRTIVIIVILIIGGFVIYAVLNNFSKQTSRVNLNNSTNQVNEGGLEIKNPHVLSIDYLRQIDYPGSDIVIEQTLTPGSNYQRYIASYKSEGLKIFGLLTVPSGDPSAHSTSSGQAGSGQDGNEDSKYPVIVFNHGYIRPSEYSTTEKYVAYTDGFSREGYIVFKPDFRGHGNSEGEAIGGYGSNAYTIDVLNAVSSIKKLKNPSNVNGQLSIVDPERIGMWGHSMGGHITLRSMVVNKDIKAGVIWAGVVASYEDLFDRWRRRNASTNEPTNIPSRRGGSWRQYLSSQYGSPEENPDFWKSLSATTYLSDISGPIQLHHGTADSSVPVEFSEGLYEDLIEFGQIVELYTYPGDDHNITANFNTAMQRSIEFFDRHLK